MKAWYGHDWMRFQQRNYLQRVFRTHEAIHKQDENNYLQFQEFARRRWKIITLTTIFNTNPRPCREFDRTLSTWCTEGKTIQPRCGKGMVKMTDSTTSRTGVGTMGKQLHPYQD